MTWHDVFAWIHEHQAFVLAVLAIAALAAVSLVLALKS
jgi:hypothetical protein